MTSYEAYTPIEGIYPYRRYMQAEKKDRFINDFQSIVR